MTPPGRRPKSAIVPRKFLGATLATAVPACALAFANACSSDDTRKDYTFVADVSAHFDDHIFRGDVSTHFDPPDPDAELPDAADADAGDGAAEDGDAQDDGG